MNPVSDIRSAGRTGYSIRDFGLDPETLAGLQRLRPWRSALALASAWLALTGLVLLYRMRPEFAWAYPLFAFLIAGRQGVLLQIVHEAAHRLLHTNRTVNNAMATWLAAYPLGLSFISYARGHINHHAYTNEPEDSPTDTEKYRVCDVRDPGLWGLFLKDLLGLTALQVLLRYEKGSPDRKPDAPGGRPEPLWLRAAGTLLVQGLILLALFGGRPLDYVLLWLVPLVIPHMMLMRVRGIAEHGLLVQEGVPADGRTGLGNLHTRSFLTPACRYPFPPLVWIEKLLIGSLNVHYHHEHHLFTAVPYYSLPRLHALIHERVRARIPQAYAKGYFSCLWHRKT